ncbi:uncharacterized protein TrAtP1_007022 [Trichoderma atroviride]|uniref:uncharacterized protein n=1 Tax=Hypocrea atroviridis TaxID=63577 RepID=UPI00331AFE48|nr:hypothetical protein TrAtP1_007022 [Trichoderma atroviride]
MAVAKGIVTVVGATGAQGALLSTTYSKARLKSATAAAKALAARGIDVVEADLTDTAALRAAFAGSYAIFAVTNFWRLFTDAQKEFSAD